MGMAEHGSPEVAEPASAGRGRAPGGRRLRPGMSGKPGSEPCWDHEDGLGGD